MNFIANCLHISIRRYKPHGQHGLWVVIFIVKLRAFFCEILATHFIIVVQMANRFYKSLSACKIGTALTSRKPVIILLKMPTENPILNVSYYAAFLLFF